MGHTFFPASSEQLSKVGISVIYCSAHWQYYSDALCRQGWVRTCWQCQAAIDIWSVHHCIPVIGCSLHCPEMETVLKDWLSRVSQWVGTYLWVLPLPKNPYFSNTMFVKEIASLFLQYVLNRMTGTLHLSLGYLIISKMERKRVSIHKAHYCSVDLSTGWILNGKGALV